MQVVKPPHNHYVFSCLDDETYIKYADVYSGCKRWGVRGIYTFLGGTNLFGVVKEISKGTIVQLKRGLEGSCQNIKYYDKIYSSYLYFSHG